MTRPAGAARSGALFDMDKTLVSVNTGRLYARWRMGRKEWSARDYARAMRYLLQYSVGMLDPQQAAAKGLRTVRGYEEEQMRDECRTWYEKVVRPHVSDHGRREVERCRERGMVVAILSAQTRYVTQPLAEDLGIEHVLCTQLEVQDGRLTGGYEEPLCYGDGKIVRAERWAEEHGVDLDDSHFYSDSISDLPMLARVGSPVVINPDFRLRLAARLRGWPVEQWT